MIAFEFCKLSWCAIRCVAIAILLCGFAKIQTVSAEEEPQMPKLNAKAMNDVGYVVGLPGFANRLNN